jgi:hypothetical protein
LEKLASQSDIQLTDEERIFMRFLKESIVWGKYPIKKRINKEQVSRKYKELIVDSHVIRCPKDMFRSFTSLFNKICEAYERCVPDNK